MTAGRKPKSLTCCCFRSDFCPERLQEKIALFGSSALPLVKTSAEQSGCFMTCSFKNGLARIDAGPDQKVGYIDKLAKEIWELRPAISK
jgi:hypothetical protein